MIFFFQPLCRWCFQQVNSLCLSTGSPPKPYSLGRRGSGKNFETCLRILTDQKTKTDDNVDLTRFWNSTLFVNARLITSINVSFQIFENMANHWFAHEWSFSWIRNLIVRKFQKCCYNWLISILKLINLQNYRFEFYPEDMNRAFRSSSRIFEWIFNCFDHQIEILVVWIFRQRLIS